MLPDAGRIQEEDAANANRHGYSKHTPALPLYTEADAFRALSLLQPVGYDRPVPVADGIEVEFINAGHLLGSSYARVRIGRPDDPLRRRSRPLRPSGAARSRRWSTRPTTCSSSPPTATACTSKTTTASKLAAIVKETAERGGKLIIPAFAIGRVEELLYWLKRLEDEQRIPVLPVFVDSPMAIEALRATPSACASSIPSCSRRNATRRRRTGTADHADPRERRREHARRERQLCVVLHRAVPDDRVGRRSRGS